MDSVDDLRQCKASVETAWHTAAVERGSGNDKR